MNLNMPDMNTASRSATPAAGPRHLLRLWSALGAGNTQHATRTSLSLCLWLVLGAGLFLGLPAARAQGYTNILTSCVADSGLPAKFTGQVWRTGSSTHVNNPNWFSQIGRASCRERVSSPV